MKILEIDNKVLSFVTAIYVEHGLQISFNRDCAKGLTNFFRVFLTELSRRWWYEFPTSSFFPLFYFFQISGELSHRIELSSEICLHPIAFFKNSICGGIKFFFHLNLLNKFYRCANYSRFKPYGAANSVNMLPLVFIDKMFIVPRNEIIKVMNLAIAMCCASCCELYGTAPVSINSCARASEIEEVCSAVRLATALSLRSASLASPCSISLITPIVWTIF